MIPAPTQPPPTRVAPPPSQIEPANAEQPRVALTPARKRVGQSPFALVIKAILRPIFKLLYYVIRWIRTHKLVTLLALILLLASIFATTYFASGQTPLSSSSNSLQQSVQSNPDLSPDVQTWLLALRAGDINTMLAVQKAMSASTRPPDSSLYVLQFSEKYAPVKWTNVAVTSINKAPDGLIDTFIETDISSTSSASGTSTTTNSVVLWHFSTTPSGRIFLLDYVSGRTV
ncbi:hypothetical protein KDA_15250 [Dictyobacter alpinus]|uniref:Uncharacterized protein n=1 Tax=Dictyobacter alpinus TaxID=2014873 RepID=A0A402B3X5_9CHLR|nr:hypothetical protein [Dictyobacter alpinus]GCE26041.1 hypothetical protein KDA_15250 [Dictyobacter alpinus]